MVSLPCAQSRRTSLPTWRLKPDLLKIRPLTFNDPGSVVIWKLPEPQKSHHTKFDPLVSQAMLVEVRFRYYSC